MNKLNKNLIISILLLLNLIIIASSYIFLRNKIYFYDNLLLTSNKEIEQLKNDLETERNLYSSRNLLDSNFHLTLNKLINNDISSIKDNFSPDITLNENIIEFTHENEKYKFIIPNQSMILRQRAYGFLSNEEYFSTYEILSSGYTNETKFNERIYTLNVRYKLYEDQWKISFINIDE